MSAGNSPSPYPPSSRPSGGPPRPSSPSAPAAPATGGQTIDPMRLLMTYWPFGVAAGIVGLILGVIVFFALSRLAPTFVSTAIFQAKPASDAVGEGVTEGIGRAGSDEMELFMETQVQNMVSDRILRQAINEPDIRETQWINNFIVRGSIDEVEALLDLRDRVGASVVPDTLYMQLRARLGNKADARTVANVVTSVYMADIRRQTNAAFSDTIGLLENKLRTSREDVANLDRRIENLLAEEQVSTIEQRESSQYAEIQQIQPRLVEIRDQRAQLREQLGTYEQLLNSPGGIQYPESIRAQAEQHPIVLSHSQNIANEKSSLRSVLTRYGENHRDVIRRKSLIAALEQEKNSLLEQKTHEGFRTTIENLRSTIANLEESESDLQERLRQAQNELVELTTVLKDHDNLQQDRLEAQEAIVELNTRITELELKTQQGGRVSLESAPELPDQMAFPNLILTVAGTAALVVAAVGGLIVLKETREQRVRGPQDIRAIPRTKVLGVIPDKALDPTKPDSIELASLEKPQGIIAETFRQLRGSINKCREQGDIKTIHVCAGMPESGATTIVTNLAIKLSSAGERVLIVDGNIRRPRIHKIFGLAGQPGLADCIMGSTSAEQSIVSTAHTGIDLLPAGESLEGVFEKLSTGCMSDLLTWARDAYDIVLVDSSPGIVAEDAISIANHCDATILVVRAFSEKRGLVARLRNQLGDTSAEFLGVIVNGVEPTAGGYFQKNYRTTHNYTFGNGSSRADSKNDEKAEANA